MMVSGWKMVRLGEVVELTPRTKSMIMDTAVSFLGMADVSIVGNILNHTILKYSEV